MYDGPASELCGSFLYEHVADGRVRRALVYAFGLDEALRWRRVEGEPEPWEAAFLAANLKLEDQLRAWKNERLWHEPPLPEPSLEEEADARERWSRISEGELRPYLPEHAQCRAVWDAVLQPQAARDAVTRAR